MSLKKEIDKLKFDKRMIEWNLSKGLITQEEVDKHMSSLPDSSQNLAQLELNEVETESDMFSGSQN